MTRAIKSYKGDEKTAVIARRIRGKTGGLGYLSAVESVARIAGKAKAEALVQEVEKALENKE
jgi:hypothetical protein